MIEDIRTRGCRIRTQMLLRMYNVRESAKSRILQEIFTRVCFHSFFVHQASQFSTHPFRYFMFFAQILCISEILLGLYISTTIRRRIQNPGHTRVRSDVQHGRSRADICWRKFNTFDYVNDQLLSWNILHSYPLTTTLQQDVLAHSVALVFAHRTTKVSPMIPRSLIRSQMHSSASDRTQ